MMRQRTLLSGCAAGAVLAALAAPAAAQSFNGTPLVRAGSATIVTGPLTTTITVDLPETVIDWTTIDAAATGAIDFLPAGTSAFFDTGPSGIDYTVLNRILPVDGVGNPTPATVAFNGNVSSVIVNTPGGHIWFYSPTGIIAGPTARFNVGSLIMTTGDIPFVPGVGGGPPGSIYGPGGLVEVNHPAGSTGFVDVRPGAQLNAVGLNNAYVALIAPRVIQAGVVRANGQVAYLAAEQVDLTIGAGLFDFVLTVGTEDADGVVHSGTTTGPASTSAADLQRISMVALPKNDALTMLLSGSIGYTPAASVANEGSTVVLAAGFTTDDPIDLPGNTLGSIEIGTATFRNQLTAYASDAVDVGPVAGTTSFLADARLYGLNAAGIAAEASEQVVALGNLELHAGAPGIGGTIDVVALDKGVINVAGTLLADASSSAAEYVAAPAILDATGGTVTIIADDGTIGALNLIAGAEATGAFGDARGGIGTGGSVDLSISGGGALTANVLALSTSARGGNSTRNGGDGFGGTTAVSLGTGTLTAATVSIDSSALGGSASATLGPAAYQSGHGFGGASLYAQNDGTATVTTLDIQSSGFGGGGEMPDANGAELAAFAGNGLGGAALVGVAGGTLTANDTAIQAFGRGADGMNHLGGGAATDGGVGAGGIAALLTPAGATGSFTAPVLSLLANGQGGDGGTGGTDGNGGNGFGFIAEADLADGAFALGAVTVQAVGSGGIGAAGGEGSGGQASAFVIDGSGPVGARQVASLDMDASGYAGVGLGGGAAQTDAGAVALIAQVLDPAAALDFTGNLTLTSTGTRSAAGDGITVAVGGAPLTIGGAIAMTSTRDVSIDAAEPLRALGSIAVDARAIAATGLIDAGATLSLIGTDGVEAERLASGGATLLQAVNGPVTVSTDLASAGAVTALGRSIDLTALGALDVASAQATAGDLRIAVGGDLTSASTQASGAVDLSSGGALAATGPVMAGGDLSLAGTGGIGAGTVVSGGTTALQSANGGVIVTALTSPGAVTAQGRFLDLDSPGALSFADAQATAGAIVIDTLGNLSLAQGSASGGLFLASVNGAIAGTGPLGAGNNASVVAPLGVTLASLGVGGTTLLRATGGTVDVDSLTSGGLMTAFGRVVDIVSPGALAFADLDATAGTLAVLTAGNLALTTADATGAASLRSTGGTLAASGSINAGGALVLEGNGGVSASTVNSGATTLLQSPNGAIGVIALSSLGLVTAQARSIDLASPGTLLISTVQATAGGVRVATQGDLAMSQASATGTLDLSSAAGAFSTTGSLTAGGDATIVAPAGITAASLTSAGTTLLRATGGFIQVSGLTSSGLVTAFGRAVDLISPGALSFADLDATAGSLSVLTAGNLTLATADALGPITLQSSGGALRAIGAVAGGLIAFTAGGSVQADANVLATGTLTVNAGGAFTLGGTARGTVVSVLSNDIALGTGAALGVRGTTLDVTLSNRDPARTTFIGGVTQAAGYSLDQGELARLFADNSITIGIPLASPAPAGQGNMAIGDLAMSFGAAGNLGPGGQLAISAPGRISITGDVAIATASAADQVQIDPSRIELDTATGSIALIGATGAPLGQLTMIGDTIAMAETATLGQLAATTDFAAINALLDRPGGAPQPLRAGTIALNVVDALYIQNSGPTGLYRDRAGFTASGLAISTTQPGARIAINGQILTAAGPLTGLDTQQQVTINGVPAAPGGQFDPGSTINGCVIGGVCAPPPGVNPPSDSDLLRPLPPDAGPPALFIAPLIELADTEPLVEPPLVDEPITGIGNDDLWEPRCAEGDDACREGDERP